MSVTPSLYAKARSEIIALFGWNADNLSPDQMLRIDCATALRLALDDLQGKICRGESIDIARILTASEALSRLLPPSVLATPPSEQHGDPRQAMWELYKQMRERGEISLKALPPEGGHQTRIDELESENERLRARLVGGSAPAPLDVPTSDICPPGERAACDVGARPGPDDPPPRSTRVIEGKALPAAGAAPPAKRSTSWDGTPHGKAWRAWHDAGGPGFDRWGNHDS